MLEHNSINAYRVMWLFVFFDLPTNTKMQRKKASDFRKNLLKDGFAMMQYSVYIRHCASGQSRDVHQQRVEAVVPEEGVVSVLAVTDKQYGNIINYWGKKTKPLKAPSVQLELF